jgi:hypothetical protein
MPVGDRNTTASENTLDSLLRMWYSVGVVNSFLEERKPTMKFTKVRKGEYKAEVRDGISIWVVREGRQWVWFLGGYDVGLGAWKTDDVGPFDTRSEAIADALANYEIELDA